MVLHGEATYRIEGAVPVVARSGEIMVLPAGVAHAAETAGSFSRAVLHLAPEAVDRLARLPASLQAVRVRLAKRTPPFYKAMVPEVNQHLEWLVEDVVAERKHRGPGHEDMLHALAAQAAVHLLRLAHSCDASAEASHGAQRLRIARDWMDRHFAERCSLAWLAGMARMAPTYFATRFQAVVGRPPMAYLRAVRMRAARDLLERTDLPVKVVAANVGYADASHFNHVFRRTHGESPAGLRARMGSIPPHGASVRRPEESTIGS